MDSLWPHESQHARPPCPSPTHRVHLNPCPLSWWCHPTISSSVVPFSSYPQSFPASGPLQMSQLFSSGGQSIEVSASTSVLSKNTQDWSSLGWTGWISQQSKGLWRVFSNTTVQKQLWVVLLGHMTVLFPDSEGLGREGGGRGGSGCGIHVNPWLIHVNVWQNPLQYCKVISLQLIKINEK